MKKHYLEIENWLFVLMVCEKYFTLNKYEFEEWYNHSNEHITLCTKNCFYRLSQKLLELSEGHNIN